MSLVWIAALVVFITAIGMVGARRRRGSVAAQESVSERWLAEQRAIGRHQSEP
jgi:hypothetical protein